MNQITVRNACASDSPLLRALAAACGTLDVHTPYTYWVACRYHSKSIFILEDSGTPVGYIMALDNPDCVFLWQIGILSSHRGKGLSKLLYARVMDFAAAAEKPLQVTIAPENKASYGAMENYCRSRGLTIQAEDTLHLNDCIDREFQETEIIYTVFPAERSSL